MLNLNRFIYFVLKSTKVYVLLSSFILLNNSSHGAEISKTDNSEDSLEFFYVVLRHGCRAPVITYPKDPYPYYDLNYWPFGGNSLTKLGREEMFTVGKHLREKYNSFLGQSYLPELFKIGYHDHIRLFQSGSCMAASLFPPEGRQIWKNNYPWQPVYMTVIPFDILELAENNGGCPAFAQESQRQLNKMDARSSEYNDLLHKISEGTGMNVTKLSQIHYIYSTLLYDIANGLELPKWAEGIFPEKMKPFYAQQLITKFASTRKLLQLGAGPELEHIGSMLNEALNPDNTTGKKARIYIELAHDNTIISLLKAMGNRNPYEEILIGAFIIYELHSVPPGHIVKVFYYRDSNSTTPEELTISGCATPCTFDSFNSFVKSFTVPNWKKACHQLKD